MTINDEITILANQLANAGNKPTVAMIKGKLNKKVPLPVIISALKVWQHDPNFSSMPEAPMVIKEEKDATAETDTFEQSLNEELVQMRQEIIELKHLVKQLIKEQKD